MDWPILWIKNVLKHFAPYVAFSTKAQQFCQILFEYHVVEITI